MVSLTWLVEIWLNWAAFCGCVLIGAHVLAVVVLIWAKWDDWDEEEEEEIHEAIARRADRWPPP